VSPGELLGVEWIWGVTLAIVVLVIVPAVLALVYRLMLAAWRIERYLARTLKAAGGIAGNTASIPALGDTIAVATTILGVAQSIDEHCAGIEKLLLGRVAAGK